MYPLDEAPTLTPTGQSCSHAACTLDPLCIIIWGTHNPIPLTKVNILVVSPFSAPTVETHGFLATAITFLSLGMFCTPLSSPDQICSGDTICRSCRTCLYSWNYLATLGSFPDMAQAIDRFTACLIWRSGCRFKKYIPHPQPAFWSS